MTRATLVLAGVALAACYQAGGVTQVTPWLRHEDAGSIGLEPHLAGDVGHQKAFVRDATGAWTRSRRAIACSCT